MKTTSVALYTAAQTRELDRITIEDLGVPGYTLMTRAGEFAFQTMMSRFKDTRCIAVVCGLGNNGGDGYVLARLAHECGIDVRVLQIGHVGKQKGDALQALNDMRDSGLEVRSFDANVLQRCSLVVDAIFGTGLQRPPQDEWLEAIQAINNAGKPVLSMDIPSGLYADTGQALFEDMNGAGAICATATATFIGRKRGLYTGLGPALCGDIYFSDLQVPSEVYCALDAKTSLWNDEQLKVFSRRSRVAHKGDFGHALLIGGDEGYSGAIRLAGESCLRGGAGLVSVATRATNALAVVQARPELMCHGVERIQELQPLIQKANVCAIGPGLGQGEWGRALFAAAMKTNLPKIVDADALNILAQEPIRRDDWILTPHPGEAARLLSCSVAEVEEDRFAACELIQKHYGGVCVLKGAGSLVFDGNSFVVCQYGNPGMSTGGSGDVLTGILTALLAQFPHHTLFTLACLGVGVHALAGDRAAALGERGMIASDISNRLRELVNP